LPDIFQSFLEGFLYILRFSEISFGLQFRTQIWGFLFWWWMVSNFLRFFTLMVDGVKLFGSLNFWIATTLGIPTCVCIHMRICAFFFCGFYMFQKLETWTTQIRITIFSWFLTWPRNTNHHIQVFFKSC